MSHLIIQRIAAAYGLTLAKVLPVQKGYRNTSYPTRLQDGRLVNIILYKSEPEIEERIKRTNRVGAFLAKRHFPARYPLSERIVCLQNESIRKYGALYNYLDGDTIPWEAYTKNHLKLAGMAMGKMHVELQTLQGISHDVTQEYEAILRRMKRYFEDTNVADAMNRKLGIVVDVQKLASFMVVLQKCRGLPSRQVLHMDFVRGNLLFRPARPEDTLTIDNLALSGVLDFEKAASGSPVFDVARTLAFLLVDCKYKSSEKITKYFLHSGYNKRSVAATIPPDSPVLQQLVTLFLLYDFYKFLRHNPYESLVYNEHYKRTKDMLLARGMIRYRKEE